MSTRRAAGVEGSEANESGRESVESLGVWLMVPLPDGHKLNSAGCAFEAFELGRMRSTVAAQIIARSANQETRVWSK